MMVFFGVWVVGLGGMGVGGDCSDCCCLVGLFVNVENCLEQQEGQQQIGKNIIVYDDEVLLYWFVIEKLILIGVCDVFDFSNMCFISKFGKLIVVMMVDFGGVYFDEVYIVIQWDLFEFVFCFIVCE